MSYLALARRYRPRRFDEVLGQESVVRALGNALDADRLHPALLLTGTRGVGKTTIARIVAKALNCETGVSSQPCGDCGSCREIDEGRFVDLLEIDAASRTKVDDTRALLDNVAYQPVRGRYKVYLIDEVHMLSGHSFNALLKTLEEPPEHVKFVLATTDPQKLPVTVLSRCLQLHLRALPEPTIHQLLASVLASEGREADPKALALLAGAADGSMRDALSLLDQALAHAGDGRLGQESVSGMLGLSGQEGVVAALRAIAAGDAAELGRQLQVLAELAVDHGALLDDLAALLQSIALAQAVPGARPSTAASDDGVAELAAALDAADAHLFYDMAVHARRDLPWAPSSRIGFEMALLRMWSFRSAAVAEAPPEDSTAGSASGGGADAPVAAPAAAPAVAAPAGASAHANASADASVDASVDDGARAAVAGARPAAGKGRGPAATAAPASVSNAGAASGPASAAYPAAPPAAAAAGRLGEGAEAATQAVPAEALAWKARVEAAALEAYARELARNCLPEAEDEDSLALCLDEAMAHLATDDRLQRLQQAFGKRIRLRQVPQLSAPTPVALARAERAEAQRRAAEQLSASPAFRAFEQQLGARLQPEDVQLLH